MDASAASDGTEAMGASPAADDVEQQQQAAAAARHPREGWPRWRFPAIASLFALASVLLGYDVSNIANIQPPIYRAFGHVELLAWVAVGYTAANVVMTPLVRKLLVLGSLRWQMAAYCGVMAVGAAVSGSAGSMDVVIVGRVITGLGGAGAYQVAVVTNVLISTPSELARVQGLMGMCWALGLILGPLVGGAFAENHHATWRWAIYINLPVLGVVAVLTVLTVPSLHVAPGLAAGPALRGVDWLGFALHASSFILLCSALIYCGPTWAWASGSSVAAWVLVGVLYAAYALQQRLGLLTSRERRLLPADLLRDRTVALISAATAAAGAAYGVTLYYTPLFFAFTRGSSPVAAAVRLLPFIGTFVAFVVLSAGAAPAVARAPPFYLAGGALIMVGAGLQTRLAPSTPAAAVMGHDALVGAGVGCLWQTGVALMAPMVPPARRMDAAGLFIVMQLGGVAVMLSVAGAVFENVGYALLTRAIGGQGYGDADVRQALAGLDSRIWDAGGGPVVAAAVAAVTETIARLHYIVLAAGALAFACGCGMSWREIDFGRAKTAKAPAAGLDGADADGEKAVAEGSG